MHNKNTHPMQPQTPFAALHPGPAPGVPLLQACLDGLDHGVLIVDSALRVHHSNAPAQRYLAVSTVMRWQTDCLQGATSAITNRLACEVHKALQGLRGIAEMAHPKPYARNCAHCATRRAAPACPPCHPLCPRPRFFA
jgi:nitrogen-specific signal transduction histidine kinase